ncbi:MAG TPA: hypothetical protein VHK90_16495 [Thermoanaerobaculia bacterium]|nr:hypothetical protein [Thermoanaerobaculia bacterium]
MRRARAGLVLLLAFAAPALAQDYDVAVAGDQFPCALDTPILIPRLVWTPGGVDPNDDVRTIAAAGGGRVLAALEATRVQLVEVRPDLTRTPFFTGAEGHTAQELVVDRAGNFFVLATSGESASILEISAAGTLLNSQPFPSGARSIDLAADQCTLFAVHDGTVIRRNVCTATPLASFATVGSGARELVILPDGDVLAGTHTADGYELRRYDPAGSLVRTYDAPEGSLPGAIALGGGGTTLLVGSNCRFSLHELDLTSGEVLREIAVSHVAGFDSIVSRRGFTAAIGALAASDVPSLSFASVAELVALLATLAAVRLQ